MASVDTPQDSREFAEMHDADSPILSDPQRTTAAAYGVIGPAGFAHRWTFYIGPDGRIRHVDRAVAGRTAGADLVRTLERLGAPRRG
jgi:peroxiredoxin Q/BCP